MVYVCGNGDTNVLCSSAKLPAPTRQRGALEVLGLLDLEGSIVTADALHCHRDFASTVLERGADYVLALEENQSKLFAAAARRYACSGARSVAERRELATHDRCEWRRATVLLRYQGGLGEGGRSYGASRVNQLLPPPLTPPHKGEGNRPSQPQLVNNIASPE